MKTRYTYEKAGQGLFFHCEIDKFSLVYDCGSSKKQTINYAIDDYNYCGTNDIDALIISHFHRDHINGVVPLLSARKVKQIFIPYIKPLEKLYYIIVNDYNYSDDGENDLSELVLDPIKYFASSETKVNLILPGKGESDEPTIPEDARRLPTDDDASLGELASPDGAAVGTETINDYGDNISTGKIWKHHGKWHLGNIWFFKFFCLDGDISKFESCCELHGINPHNVAEIRKILDDDQKIYILKKCYKQVRSSLNATSLCLGFWLLPRDLTHSAKSSYDNSHTVYRCCSNGIFSNLLTGDIDLSTTNNWNEFSTHYNSLLNNGPIHIQIPHHGSIHNWNRNLLTHSKYLLTHSKYSKFFVVSAGKRSRYRHPHPSILMDILYAGHYVDWTHEDSYLRLVIDS